MAMQVQLFDNGDKPGKGRSQHALKLEAYCEGRLDLYRPYWVRTVQLTSSKVFISWVERQRATGEISDEQYKRYDVARRATDILADDPDIEFAKLGHIGSARENIRYVEQFVSLVKTKGGGLTFILFIDGEEIDTSSFLFDQRWTPGSARRKFFGFYDPCGMYAAMKAEQAQRVEAESRARTSATAQIGGAPWE